MISVKSLRPGEARLGRPSLFRPVGKQQLRARPAPSPSFVGISTKGPTLATLSSGSGPRGGAQAIPIWLSRDAGSDPLGPGCQALGLLTHMKG